jgi:hypothetical protein
LAGLYCITFVGPLWHTLRGIVRDRDLGWLWHMPACIGSFIGSAWGLWTYKTRGKDRKIIADLQVKQSVKDPKSKPEKKS